MWIYIISGIVALSLIYAFATYNTLIRLSIKVMEAFATMDVYLKKRWDLIPRIVLTVTGYIKYERETLDEVIRIRSGIYDMMSPNDKIYTNEKLNTDISKIMMVAEKYPDLKTNQNFLDLSTQLSEVENDIADAGKYYNTMALIINNNMQMFPNNMVATLFRFKACRMFEAAAAE